MPLPKRDDIHTTEGKQEFIKNFLNSVRDELIAKAAQMPETWNGHELRWLVADKIAFEQHHRVAQFRCITPSWRTRIRDYKNEALVRNL